MMNDGWGGNVFWCHGGITRAHKHTARAKRVDERWIFPFVCRNCTRTSCDLHVVHVLSSVCIPQT